jgi:hypothetical protein
MKRYLLLCSLFIVVVGFSNTDVLNSKKQEVTEINCDTIYKGKGYSIQLVSKLDTVYDETHYNAKFILYKRTKAGKKILVSDSIYNRVPEIRFEDFNNDGIKDILVQNVSDVRSNYTYYLYLVDLVHDRLTKIKGFEEIKNPHYLPEYNLIDNYVMSGQIWTNFYRIQGSSITDYHIVIYDNQTEDGSYDRAYEKAIQKITQKPKSRPKSKH